MVTPTPHAPQTLVLFGVPFHDVTFEETLEWCVRRMRSGRPACIATANVDFLMQATRDPELQRILLEADLVIADGMPIVWLARRFGPALRQRVTGSDLSPMLATVCARKGLGVFLLGGAPGVAEKAAEVLVARNPGLRIAGTYSPPLASLLEMEHEPILRRLRESKPDLLLVAFGAPKQEKFIHMHLGKHWEVPLAIGIGGTLDFLAGTQTRAPRWTQRIGFEWLWRMCTNPKRLFKRYASNIGFLASALWRLERIKRQPRRPPLEDLPATPWSELEADLGDRATFHSFCLGPRDWLDSRELGLLVQAAKRFRSTHGRLFVHGGTPRVQALITASGLGDYLEYRPTAAESEERRRQVEEGARTGSVAREGTVLSLILPAELQVASLPKWTACVDAVWDSRVTAVTVEAAPLEFLDSAGLGWLAAFRKRCLDSDAAFACSGLKGAPLQTIRLSRMEAYFTA